MPDPAWAVYFYRRPDGALPGEGFLDRCPTQVEAHFSRLLQAVAAGPPPVFPGGGYWEAMHGDMAGYYESRKSGRLPTGRGANFRLFCLLEHLAPGLPTPPWPSSRHRPGSTATLVLTRSARRRSTWTRRRCSRRGHEAHP